MEVLAARVIWILAEFFFFFFFSVDFAIRSFHLSIDDALAVSYRTSGNDKKALFVAHITLVKGIPFYGYYVGYRFFLKIYLLNPFYVTRLADLLLQGAVMKRTFQPYESHLQYIPQWMCDYNLYGCAYMKCNKVTFRGPIPEYLELMNTPHRWHDRSIHLDSLSDELLLPKQSHCNLEVDICVRDILNRLDVKGRPLHQDFTEFLNPAPLDERLVPSVASLWKDETRRRKKRLGITDKGSSPFGPEELISMSAEPRDSSTFGWLHEEEYRHIVLEKASHDSLGSSKGRRSFADYVKERPFEAQIKTASDSVNDFFPEKLEHSSFEEPQPQNDGKRSKAEAHVNEQAALSFGSEELSYDSDDVYLNDFFGKEGQGIEDLISDELGDDAFDPSFPAPLEREYGAPSVSKVQSNTDIALRVSRSEPHGDIRPGTSEANRSKIQVSDETLNPIKRPQEEGTEDKPVLKRTRNIHATDERDVALNNGHRDVVDSVSWPSQLSIKTMSLQSSAASKSGGQSQGINFPVVKDPYNPMTALRFSQEKSHSPKVSAGGGSQFLRKPHAIYGPGKLDSSGQEPVTSSPLQESSSALESSASEAHVSEVAATVHDAFNMGSNGRIYCFRRPCPTPSDVSSTISSGGRPSVIYQKPYYSNEEDVSDRQMEYAGRDLQLQSNTIRYLPEFDPSGRSSAMFGERCAFNRRRDWHEKLDQQLRESSRSRLWEFAAVPPSRSEVIEWYENMQREAANGPPKKGPVEQQMRHNTLSQIEGPTQNSDHGLEESTSVEHEAQYMSVMSLEVHVNTRGILAPNPEEDEVTCIFYCVQYEAGDMDVDAKGSSGAHVGMISHGTGGKPEAKISKAAKIDVEHEPTELDLITRVVDMVRFHDPDILTGYEVHNSSWGYLIERARKKYDYDLCDELSRVKSQAYGRYGKDADRWGFNHSSSIRVTGRHMINIWRTMRSELSLLQYTQESVVFHVLKRRIPHYHFQDLTSWYLSAKPRNLLKVIEYFISRVQMNIEILDATELISRTSEQARLLGVDFFSVLSRGSQFKVESLMFRIAKPENFLLVSPSKRQVGGQNALECLPLVMEPQSDFYTSPVVVLDFQSLYPSLMIAYNYCYSTFFGRVSDWRGRDKMGFTDYERQPHLLQMLLERINIAPNGMMYVKPEVRRSLLARMLSEILETRVMVRTGMKADKDDKILQRLLNSKQLALKFIANVTYGYTSASFSGRMPCSEIADSIVLSGRETLEKAINLIHSVEQWGAEVVYGDTDSLFVYLRGKTRDEAFDIGEEIAKAVTEANPRPVKLKFEKVYHPCVLLAKKRYVGFKYEHRDQEEPEFDAKGIETVRRDGTPAEQKIEEKALKILFRTADLSRVKSYFQKQCTKIMQGKVSIQDFCFAREVRLGTYSTLPPPGAVISTKKMLEDPRSEPQYGERVPYVVIAGAPGSRVVDRCVAPETLLHDAEVDLDAEYYITKNIIPPLERIFNLVGANVRLWYDEMPKFHGIRRVPMGIAADTSTTTTTTTTTRGTTMKKRFGKTLESYMKSSSCIVCKSKKLENTEIPICGDCMAQPHVSFLNVCSRLQQAEKRVMDLSKVCRSCMGVPFGDQVKCDSKDCPVFYSRTRDMARWSHTKTILDPAVKLLEEQSEGVLEW